MVLRKYGGEARKDGCDSISECFKKEEKHDLAIVRYPSLSIDLLYDFKEVQPMPNHPAIIFFSTY